MGNSSDIEWGNDLGVTVVDSTILYPRDLAGNRVVPVIIKDVYGRVSRIEDRKLNQREYEMWLKDPSYGK